MVIKFTARHFKPQESLREYAYDTVQKLERYYDGIVKSEVILGFERTRNSVKTAEIHLTVYGTLLKAVHKSDDYQKSIETAVAKLERQLVKYKSKLHEKEKSKVRKIYEKD
ncbi:MAG TPA: ribosome-associated translation inhibitor RaiA [Bacteroidota bacterium]|nr:ribosome-associated translation inhibitor RaiA [Bacteroidota bacterium]